MDEQKRTYQPRVWFLLALFAFAAIARLIPYAVTDPTTQTYLWGVTPLFAIALFGGRFFRDRRWAFAIPLGAYLIGDVAIAVIFGHPEWAVYKHQPIVYGTVVAVVAIGFLLRRYRSGWAVAGAGVAGATLFYLTTNFGVWATGGGTFYPYTSEGLLTCYIAGIPHFLKYMISTLAFSVILFSPVGVRALAASEEDALEPSAVPEKATVRA